MGNTCRQRPLELPLELPLEPTLQPRFREKVVILGGTGAGKTTLLRQIESMYGSGPDTSLRESYKTTICDNVFASMRTLIEKSQLISQYEIPCDDCRNADAQDEIEALRDCLDEFFPSDLTNIVLQFYPPHLMDDATASLTNQILYCDKINNELDSKDAEAIEILWNDAAIKTTFRHRYESSILDTVPYFFEKIHELASSEYVPTNMDIVRCYDDISLASITVDIPRSDHIPSHVSGDAAQAGAVRVGAVQETDAAQVGAPATGAIPSGAVEADDTTRFSIYAHRGARAERRKWVTFFHPFKGIIFVVALSQYNQCCAEDGKTNLLEESLLIFDKICNYLPLKGIKIALLFNKTRLMQQKLNRKIPFIFEGYEGAQDFHSIVDFVKRRFEQCDEGNERNIHIQFGNVIENDFNICKIFDSFH